MAKSLIDTFLKTRPTIKGFEKFEAAFYLPKVDKPQNTIHLTSITDEQIIANVQEIIRRKECLDLK